MKAVLITVIFLLIPGSITAGCLVDVNGITVSGSKKTGTAVSFSVNALNSCGNPVYYRYSLHPDYGTIGYDGLHWSMMTSSEYTTERSISYTFNQAGKYIVVVWAKASTTDPNTGVKMVGLEVEIRDTITTPDSESWVQTIRSIKIDGSESSLVKSFCLGEWPEDYSMQKYCVDKNVTAAQEMEVLINQYSTGNEEMSIMGRCFESWYPDISMILYCSEKEITAYHSLNQ